MNKSKKQYNHDVEPMRESLMLSKDAVFKDKADIGDVLDYMKKFPKISYDVEYILNKLNVEHTDENKIFLYDHLFLFRMAILLNERM